MTTVKVGTTIIKIYHGKGRLRPGCEEKHYDQFTVTYRENGKRKRENFGNLAKAKARAHEIAVLIERGERDVLKLTNADRSSYLSAIRLLEPHGIPLHAAVSEYVSARAELNGESLLAAIKEHVHRQHRVIDRPISEIVDQMLKAKKAAGLSNRYIWSLQSHLARFASAFRIGIGSITAPLISEWLESLKVGPRSRNNIRLSIITLFRFARGHGYLPKGEATEAEATLKAKDTGGKIDIFTPQELSDLLKGADEESRLYIVIGAFTGVRSAELLRLDWSDVNFERGHITISAHKSKTATRRLVPILPNLSQWLAPYRNQVGKIFATRAARRARSIAKSWPNNVLRHSYATYRLAITHDAGRVALEMGNSPSMLFRNYLELADEQTATAWFAIGPKRPKNVVAMAQRA
jgi:integrase